MKNIPVWVDLNRKSKLEIRQHCDTHIPQPTNGRGDRASFI
jgi:hypothetical protein